MRRIILRADADATIGFGHFIRTLALADILKNEYSCLFVTTNPTSYQIEEVEKVCECIPLSTASSKRFLAMIKEDDIVVLDNYFFSSETQKDIKEKGAKLVCIDDLHDKHYYADAIINHSPNVSSDLYSAEPYTKFYLGLQYSLLRKPFLNAIAKTEPRKRNDISLMKVVISFGSADPLNLIDTYINAITVLPNVKSIVAIVGEKNSIINKKIPKVIFRSSLSADLICEIFKTNDIAILSAGTIIREALACGIYVIGGYFVQNQIENYQGFVDANAIIGIGDMRKESAIAQTTELLSDKSLFMRQPQTDLFPTNIQENLLQIFRAL
jgi:UDP-2,4-diacetamido-2,4,6-trideoxy-beta-L-altropyranose hydrolase